MATANAITPKALEMPTLLVGEGKDELRFFGALLKHLGRTDVQVEECQGKDGLRRYLKALVVRTGFETLERILIVQDGDNNPDGRFNSVRDIVANCDLVPPMRHAQISDGKPAVGVFIMPDGLREGMLEDLCLSSVADDPAMKCVDGFISCVEELGNDPKPRSKARLHAWLASRESPGKLLGEAADAGEWKWRHATFRPLIAFLDNAKGGPL